MIMPRGGVKSGGRGGGVCFLEGELIHVMSVEEMNLGKVKYSNKYYK